MSRYCTCPIDQYERCQEVWKRHIEPILREKGKAATEAKPEGFFSECGKRPPKEGKRPRGRPRLEAR
jgi:hypothetical protein